VLLCFPFPVRTLHENGWAQILVRVPPVGWAGSRAASAENAFVHPVKLGSVLFGLEVLGLSLFLVPFRLQPWLDGSVLLVKVTKIWNQILHDIHVWQWVHLGRRLRVIINVGQAGQRVGSVDVHGARSTDPLAARSAEGQGGVLLRFDFEQRIQNHRAAVVQIHWVRADVRLLCLLWIPSVHLEILDAFGIAASGWCRACGSLLERRLGIR